VNRTARETKTTTKLKSTKNMKTVNVTKNRTMKLPDTFTMKELQRANPEVKSQTLYQRVQALKKEGAIVERGEVKRVTSKEKGITKKREKNQLSLKKVTLLDVQKI
jgi:DNA-binding HxlR family transcriptional regulator